MVERLDRKTDGFVSNGPTMKENFCFNKERVSMRDSSLEVETELLRIGKRRETMSLV